MDLISSAEMVTFEDPNLGNLLDEYKALDYPAIEKHLGQMKFRGSGIQKESAPKESGIPKSGMQESGIQSMGGQRADTRASGPCILTYV